jgi:hypothetical protein
MKYTFAALLFFFTLALTAAVFAQENSEQSQAIPSIVEEITTKDLGVENPGILPTSPFYFLKSITRNIKRVFTINPVKKTELELEIANQQAAEIKKLEEVAPNRVDAISKAVANYQTNVERLKNRLDELKETSQNPNINELVEKLTNRSIKHQQLFDELKNKFEDNKELGQQIEVVQEKISEAVAKVPEKFDNPEAFRERIEKIFKLQPEEVVNELKKLEIIDRIGSKIPAEQGREIEIMKENIVKEIGDKIEKMPAAQQQEILKPEFLEMLPGDILQRVKILDEVKSGVRSLEIKEKIKETGEKMLENKIEKGEIGKEEVFKMMDYVRNLIIQAENAVAAINNEEFWAQRQKLLKEIKIRLSKAETILNEGKIGEAFGIVNSVGAELKKFLIQPTDIIKPTKTIDSESVDASPLMPASSAPIKPQIAPIAPELIKETQEEAQGINQGIAPLIKNIMPIIPLMPQQ